MSRMKLPAWGRSSAGWTKMGVFGKSRCPISLATVSAVGENVPAGMMKSWKPCER